MFEKDVNNYIFGDSARMMVAYAHRKYVLGNEMGYFVILMGVGSGRLALSTKDPHEYRAIIDAIHNYQAKHPRKKVKEGYTEGLLVAIKVIGSITALCMVFDILFYEFEKQKNGTSALRLDYDMLLKKIKEAVDRKIDKFRVDDPDFDRWYRDKLQLLEEKSWER